MRIQVYKAFPLKFEFDGIQYSGEAIPFGKETVKGMPQKFSILLNKRLSFHIQCTPQGWKIIEKEILPRHLTNAVGDNIYKHYKLNQRA